jgi:MoxR-like ATPase
MQAIVDVHYPGLRHDLLKNALELFFSIRDLPGLKKKPSTSELLDWLKLLVAEQIPPEMLRTSDEQLFVPPLHGALVKNEQDMHLFERLVLMNRQGR